MLRQKKRLILHIGCRTPQNTGIPGGKRMIQVCLQNLTRQNIHQGKVHAPKTPQIVLESLGTIALFILLQTNMVKIPVHQNVNQSVPFFLDKIQNLFPVNRLFGRDNHLPECLYFLFRKPDTLVRCRKFIIPQIDGSHLFDII